MKICIIGKVPPIQGGTSRSCLFTAYALACAGNKVYVVTNANEVESEYRIFTMDYFNKERSDEFFSLEHKNLKIFSTNFDVHHAHIPCGDLFVTKLASLAVEIVRQYKCDFIFSYYLEPYCVAANLVSAWSGVPFIVRHAGSDIEKLLNNNALTATYREVLNQSSAIMTSIRHMHQYIKHGIDIAKLFISQTNASLLFSENTPKKMNLNDYIRYISTLEDPYIKNNLGDLFNKKIDTSLPIIGMYGKVNKSKGHFLLVKALKKLKDRGEKFNFICLTQGSPKGLKNLIACINFYGVQERVWILPYVPPSAIPAFIGACAVVCYLENNFSIECHMPFIPLEVMSFGGCLLLSKQIANKQIMREKLVHLENVLLVDPEDIDALTSNLKLVTSGLINPNEIGAKARNLVAKYVCSKTACTSEVNKEFDAVFLHAKKINNFRRNLEDEKNKLFVPKKNVKKNNLAKKKPEDLEEENNFHNLYSYCCLRKLKFVYQRVFAWFPVVSSRFFPLYMQTYSQKNLTLDQLLISFSLFLRSIENDSLNLNLDFLNEIARFELQYFLYTVSKPPRKEKRKTLTLACKPRLDYSALVERFNYDFEINVDPLFTGVEVVKSQPFFCAFLQRNSINMSSGILRLSEELYRLLCCCDGEKTVEEIIAKLGANVADAFLGLRRAASLGLLKIF